VVVYYPTKKNNLEFVEERRQRDRVALCKWLRDRGIRVDDARARGVERDAEDAAVGHENPAVVGSRSRESGDRAHGIRSRDRRSMRSWRCTGRRTRGRRA
jgi:hypothetical protein